MSNKDAEAKLIQEQLTEFLALVADRDQARDALTRLKTAIQEAGLILGETTDGGFKIYKGRVRPLRGGLQP